MPAPGTVVATRGGRAGPVDFSIDFGLARTGPGYALSCAAYAVPLRMVVFFLDLALRATGVRASGGVPAFSHFADTFSFPVSASPAPTDPESAIVRREPLSCGFFFYLIFTCLWPAVCSGDKIVHALDATDLTGD
jgi:hypothetical protein